MDGVTYTYTVDDFIAAQRLHAWQSYVSVKGLRALLILWAIYFGLAMLLTNLWPVSHPAILAVATGAVTIAVAAGITGVNALLTPRRSRRLYQQQRALHEPFELRWSGESFELSSGSGSGRHPWNHFVKAVEDRHSLMLYQSDLLYNLVPKRVVDETSLASMRAALHGAGVPLRSRR